MSKRGREDDEISSPHGKRAGKEICESEEGDYSVSDESDPLKVSESGSFPPVQTMVWKDVPRPSLPGQVGGVETSMINQEGTQGGTAVPQLVDGSIFSPFLCQMNTVPMQQVNLPLDPSTHIVPFQFNAGSSTLSGNSSQTNVPDGGFNILLKPATAAGSERGLRRYDLNRFGDFNMLYNLCSGLLKCKVNEIFMSVERWVGNTQKMDIINKDDRVADKFPTIDAVVKVYPKDGKMNVDYRLVELKCTMDMPDNRKLTKLIKFSLKATLMDVKKQWCRHIQRDPAHTFITVPSYLHGGGPHLTLSEVQVKNGCVVRTISTSYEDYPGFDYSMLPGLLAGKLYA